jgi:hypothetical protein
MTKEEVMQLFETAYSKVEYKILFKKAETETDFFFLVWSIAREMPDEQAWRYLWILDHATEKSNSNLLPILDDLYSRILKTTHESMIRQTMKLILRCPINEDFAAELLDRCLTWMTDRRAKISSQCLGLEFFFKTCNLYPEMAPELLAYIDDILQYAPSAGYKFRLNQIRRQLL